VPSGTDGQTIARLNAALNETVNDPRFQQRLQDLGAAAATAGPEEADAYVKGEIDKWREVIRLAGVSMG